MLRTLGRRWRPLAAGAALACLALTLAAPAHAESLTFTPSADTYVSSGAATASYGNAVTLRADDTAPVQISYVKFDVTGVPSGATGVSGQLTVHGTGATQPAGTIAVYSVPDTWTGSTTYNTRPALGAQVGTASVDDGATATVTVPLSGNGTVSYALVRSTTGAANILASSENTNTALRPTLAVNYTPATSTPPPPPPPSPSPSASVALPADSGAVFLGNAPYNVKCDGVTDNTAAIKQAMTDYGANASNVANRFATRTLLLPAGTCLVSDTLTPRVGGTVDRGNALKLQGAGETATTIKLKDTATGFTSATTPKYVVQLGIEPGLTLDNAAYANYISDLTVDVGNGNAGAMGIRFAACNSGAIERVTIRGGTGTNTSGLRGLATEKSGGAAYALNVTIEGFGVGLYTDDQSPANDFVFKGLTLKNQRTVGIQNNGRTLTMEGTTVTGAPKAYEAATDRAGLVAVDSTLTGSGSGTAISAAANSFLHLRNVTAPGWGNLVTTGTTSRFVGKTAIAEWSTQNYRRGNTSVAWTETTPVQSLNLPSPDAPRSTDYDLNDWVKAAVTSGDANDDGPALQAAIDSGKKVVYVPWGDYNINSTVIVRGNVEAIELMGAKVGGAGKISVGATTSPFVEIRNSALSATVEHNSAAAVTIRNMGPLGTAPGNVTDGASATGDLFLENVGGRVTNLDRPINVFGRHFGREGRSASYTGGATVRLLGENLEMHDGKAPFMTANGVTLEVIGGAADNLATGGTFNSTTGPALFDATGSTLSIVQTGVQDAPAVTGHLISDDAIETTSANTVVTSASGAYTRVLFPLYVSP